MADHDESPTAAEQATAAPADAPPAAGAPGDAQGSEPALSEHQVKLALRRVKDPELNLNIVDLGLVYGIAIAGRNVRVDMTLTSPACPSGPELMTGAEEQLRSIPEVGDVAVQLVWDPLWSPDRIEPRIRAYLGL